MARQRTTTRPCTTTLHTRCEKSGNVGDVPDQLGQQVLNGIPQPVLDQIESNLGFRIRQVQVELVGEYT